MEVTEYITNYPILNLSYLIATYHRQNDVE